MCHDSAPQTTLIQMNASPGRLMSGKSQHSLLVGFIIDVQYFRFNSHLSFDRIFNIMKSHSAQ